MNIMSPVAVPAAPIDTRINPDADVRLTDAGSLLVAARIRLADYVDGIPGIVTRPIQTLSTDAGQ